MTSKKMKCVPPGYGRKGQGNYIVMVKRKDRWTRFSFRYRTRKDALWSMGCRARGDAAKLRNMRVKKVAAK